MADKNIPFKKHEVEEYERKRYRGIDQRIVHSREIKLIKKALAGAGKDKASVLDVPCGYGRFSSLLLGEGLSLINSDISFHMVKRAVEQSQKHTEKPVSGVVADVVRGIPFKDGAFELLFSMRFLHHIHESEKREKIFKEFSRVSSGWAVLSYYQLNFLHVRQRKFRKKIKKSRTRIKMITRAELKRVAGLGGFKVVRIFPLIKGIHSQHIVLLRKNCRSGKEL